MTLLEYIASLQDQGLSDKEIFDKAQEWKKNNPPVEDKVVDDVIDEAKTKGVVDKTDATASPKQPDASETSFSDVVYGNGDLKYQEGDFDKMHKDLFGKSIKEFEKEEKKYKQDQINSILKKYKSGTPERTIAYYQLELAPDETIDNDLYNVFGKYQKEKKEGESFNDFLNKTQQEVLKPENEFLNLQKINNIRKAFGGDNLQTNKAIVSYKELDKVSDYISELSKKDIPEIKPTIADIIMEPIMDITGRFIGTVENIPIGLETSWESAKLAGIDFIKNTAGQDAADFLTGKMPETAIAFIDPNDNSEVLFSKNPERWKELSRLKRQIGSNVKAVYSGTDNEVGKFAEDYMIEQFGKVKKLSETRTDVGGIVSGFKKGDIPEIIGGVFNAVGSLIETAAPAALTRGGSLFPQIVAPMYVDYNVSKANSKYKDSENPIEELVRNNETEINTPLTLGVLAMSLEYAGLKGISKQIAGYTGKYSPFASLLLTQNKEGLTEVFQLGTEEINKSLADGKNLNNSVLDGISAMASEDGLESYLQGLVGSTVVSAPSTIAKALRSDKESLAFVNQHIETIGGLQKARALNKNKAFRDAIDIEINTTENSLKEFLENNYISAKLLDSNQKAEVLNLVSEKEKNNKILKDLNVAYINGEIDSRQYGSAKGAVVNKNKKLSNDIFAIKNSIDENLIKENLIKIKQSKAREAAKIISEQLESDFETFDTQEGYEKRVQEIKDQGGEVQESTGYGQSIILNDKKIILINDRAAAEDFKFTTDQHEILHPFFQQTFKDNPELSIIFGKNLLSEIVNNKDISITNSNLENRFRQYLEDPKYSAAATWEEVIPLVSEAMSNGDIVYNEKTKGFFESLIDLFNNLFRSGKQPLNITFDTGKDIFNFLKDYNKTIQSGKGLSEVQLAVAKEGAKGALVEGEVKIDQRTKGAKAIKSFESLMQDEVTDTAAKESKRVYQEVEAMKPDLLDSNKKKDATIMAAYSLVDEAKRRMRNINLSEDVIDDIARTFALDEKRGLVSLIDKWTPDRNDSVMGYLNSKSASGRSLFDARLQEFYEADPRYNEIIQSESQEGVTEKMQRQTATEQDVEVSTKPVTTLIKPSSLISNDAVAKIKENIASKIKGIDPEQMTFKKLGDLAPEIIAQEIGIPVKKLTDPTANLSKGDANAIQRFVNKNADKLLKILPEGAVIEAATDKLLGTSTGVPKGLLNAFYTKKPRITKGAGLSPFALNKGITKADFLKTFGIVEGKKAEDFSARSSEAQALKGIANLYGRLVTNEIVRSETDLNLEVKQDIAAGKSKSMASKRITPENLEELKGLSILRSKTDLAKSLRYNSPSINEQNRKTIQDQIQEAVEKYGLDTATLRAGMMGSGGRQSFYGKIVDGKFVKGKKGTIGVEKYVKTTDGRYFLEKSAEGSLGSEITNWVAKPGRLYYGEKDPVYIKLIESTKEYKGKKPIKINIKNAFTDKAKVQSKVNMDVLDHVVNQLADAVANGMSLDVAGTIIVQSYQATSGLIKIAAPFLYRSNTMEYAGKGSKPEQRKGEKYREEHNPPASVVGAYIMWAIKNNKAQPIMQAIRDNYYQTQLSKKDDFLLDMAKLDSTLPEGFTIFDNPIVRLAAAGIDLNTITNPYTGKTMAETVNAGIPLDVYNSYNESQKLEAISYQNEQIIKAISDLNYNPSQTIKAYLPLVKGKAMASKRNSDLIPDSIKYDKAVTVKTSIDALSKADKALNNARKLNAPVKKIRVFDFDDTLARTNSRVIYTMPNFEGGFSPESVRQKAIFMVGGPGAGKTNIGKGLKLGRQGYKVVNQDIALEVMKAEAGLPAKEAEYTTEQISTRAKLGAAARKAAVAKFDKYAANGDGMVIDGTGASYPATMKKVKQLQDAGYEVHMVVANTSLETALARNKARVERSLPDFIVERSWNQVQESTELYRKDFGDKLYEINTEEIGFGEDLPQDFLDKVYAGINSNIQGKLEAGTFAEQATDLEAQGAEWNFSEFSKVIDGKEGPLFKVAKIIADKRGTKDIFVLTARPADAAKPIQQFLKSLGLNIPIKNITGLGDGAAEAKARWIMDKASEGYNDFYFADDVTGNVKAVEEVLSQIDVKSKVQQAKASKRQDFDRVINDMIFDTAGIETYKKYSAAKARTVGAGKGKYNFFIPAGAEDFTGLLYEMIGKGKKGDAQMAFLKQNLLDTYNRSEISVTQAKIAAMNDFIALKTQLKTLPKTLNKQTGIGKFNYSHAIRVFIWQSQGVEIPGLSKKDIQDLTSFVESDPKLKVFAEQLFTIQKDKPYPSPSDSWLAGTISSDIINDINTVKRAEYQQEFRENVDIIFSEENLNKMEAAYGTNWRAAIEDSIRRMKSGSNRPKGGDSTTQGILDWLNNSVGAVMFLNTRSALLQTISSVNFINWSDNNIFKAGLAFANQKQFWKDFITLMNSDYLVERRNGLKINISESEIADAAANSKNKATAIISYILNKGFVMTQIADSFAIASGGSTFYRNRIKSLVKSGMDPKLAEQRAFEDFRAIAEESQQSSNPVRISKQQASTAGRVILAWANTPMQYARIQKRAIQDLVNGRGNAKANVSKIIYYGIVQNLLFNTLQSAIDAIGFGDDDDDDSKEELKNTRKEKAVKVANGMLDSQLRGLGITGAAVSSLKNFLLTLMEENDKKRPEYEEAVEDLFAFSPPLGSKVGKIYGGLRSFSWNKKEMKEKGWSLDNPAYLAVAQVFTGLTNVPVDRVVKKTNNMRGIFSELSVRWQKIALILGWSTYDVGLPYYGGFDAVEPLTPEEEAAEAVKLMMDQTNTAEQKQMLEELGLTKAEIKELKYEENRVNKIIELKNKPIEKIETKEEVESTKKEVKPKEEVKPKKLTAEQRLQKQFDSIKAENKPDQVKTLTNFGLSKKEIRALKYEEDRVNKILELMSKKQ